MTPGFPIGGAETFLINLLNRFRSQINPTVISLGAGRDSLNKLDPSINVIELKRKRRYDLSVITKLKSIIKENDIDCAFIIGFFPFFFFRYAVTRAKPIKVFLSLHSTKPRSLKGYIQGLIYSRLLNGEEKLITVCKNQATYLSKIYKISLSQFNTIYNGVDTNNYTLPPSGFNRKQFRESLQIPDDAYVIIQVATFRKEKKHKDSLRALRMVHTDYNLKPYLLFVGSGDIDIENKIRGFTQKYKLSEYVKFCGKQDDVRSYYWISNLFTLSSSTEAFSIAAIEAMACGLPCVLTDVGGANEMISEGINGYLVPSHQPRKLADTWIKVIKNYNRFTPDKIRQRIVEKFSLDECLKQYGKLFSSE